MDVYRRSLKTPCATVTDANKASKVCRIILYSSKTAHTALFLTKCVTIHLTVFVELYYILPKSLREGDATAHYSYCFGKNLECG